MGEKRGPRYLHVPDPHKADVWALLSLSVEKIQKVAETLRSKDNLPSEQPPIEALAKGADLSDAQAWAIWTTVPNLTRQRVSFSLTDDEFIDDLKAISPDDAAGIVGEKRTALLDLLSETEEGYLLQKAEFLRSGFVPSVTSSRTICDVRPLFDKDYKSIEAAAQVILLGLTTRDDQRRMRTIVV